MKILTCLSIRHRRAARGASRGFTLLEVLISGVVISVGLLGVAAMVPMARHLIIKAVKADMASCYGRAGLRMIASDGHLEAGTLNWNGNGGVGTNRTSNSGKDGFDYHCSAALMEFLEKDINVQFPMYKLYSDETNYQWLATIRNLGNDFFEVSVAVCHNRAANNYSSAATFNGGFGGGNITGFTATDMIKPGEWIYVYASANNGRWFKVMDISKSSVTVTGPDWRNSGGSVTVATPGGVIGVFTEVMSNKVCEH